MNDTMPPPWSNAPIRYEERIVAYFDVLGWKNLIERAGDDAVLLGQLRSLVGLYGWVQQELSADPNGSALTAFSDNVVISQRYSAANVQEFVDNMGLYQVAAARNGFFLRGAVTVGSLVHERTCVFGPALVRAHQLESKEAKYPRVILDPACSGAFGSPRHVRMLADYPTIDAFGADFARACTTPTCDPAPALAGDPAGGERHSTGSMVARPAASLEIVLTKVEEALKEVEDAAVDAKLLWLREQVKTGLASLRT